MVSEEADVWIATSEDVPGLILKSPTCDALIERVNTSLSELLELNNLPSVSAVSLEQLG